MQKAANSPFAKIMFIANWKQLNSLSTRSNSPATSRSQFDDFSLGPYKDEAEKAKIFEVIRESTANSFYNLLTVKFFLYSIIIFFSVNFFGSGMVKKSRRASRAVTVATFTHECYFRWFVKCQQVFKINLQIEVMKRSKFLLRSCEHVNHSTAANSKQHGTGLFRYARWTSV